jgi:transcriptional regulator with XRE-family HTH domain
MKTHPKTQSAEELQQYLTDRVRKSRLLNGYSQTDLSNYSKVSYSSLRKFEQTGEISLTSLLRIAFALNESIHFENLFPRANFYTLHSSGLIKRPKRCKNGSYSTSRIPKISEIERYIAFEDDPTNFKKIKAQSTLKKSAKQQKEKPWDPIEEMEAIIKENQESEK